MMAEIECGACGVAAARMICSGCQHIGYCSEECRSSDWIQGHFHECQGVQQIGAKFIFSSKSSNKKKKKKQDEPVPVKKETDVVIDTCLMSREDKVMFVADVKQFENNIFLETTSKKGAVQRLVYGNSLECELILNQVQLAQQGPCSESEVRTLHLAFGNDESLNNGMPFAWANYDETPTEVEKRVGKPKRLQTKRISHGLASPEALAIIQPEGFLKQDAEVFQIDIEPSSSSFDFKQVLSPSESTRISGKIFLRARVRVRLQGATHEFLLKAQMPKLPRKGLFYLWVIDGRAVVAAGRFNPFLKKPVRGSLVLKARVEDDGTTISVPAIYFVAATATVA